MSRDEFIWDLHCHLTGIEGRTPDECMTRLLEIATRLGVQRIVVFMGITHANNPTPAQLREQNDEVIQAISHWHDRAFGFAYLNPEYEEESLAELDRCVQQGRMVGIKLWVAVRCHDRRLDRIVRRAVELKLPIYQHTWLKTNGNLPGESTPDDLAELAARHPDANFICGHTGGNWELGIRSIRPLKNVWIDLGGGDPADGWVDLAVRELGAERILYGSDAPGRSFASQLGKVQNANLTDKQRQMILGGNLRQLLRPILLQQGLPL